MKRIRRKDALCLLAATWLLTAWLATLALADEVAEVRHVIDGDTIVLVDGRHVRYQGIDAPEIAHDNQPGDPFGQEARLYNERLVQGRKVRLKLDEQSADHYGRILAQVFLPDGTWINREMVAAGLAYVCLYNRESPTAVFAFKELLNVQRKAISAQRGIWAVSPAKTEPFYIANKRTMRVHRPDCPSARETARDNTTVFHTRNDAFMQGFCPCRRCKP